MKITYTLIGDYYRPNLVAPESPKVGRVNANIYLSHTPGK